MYLSKYGLLENFNAIILSLKPQLHSHDSGHDSSRFETDCKIGAHRDASGRKKRKSSLNTVSHDAPKVCARLIYESFTTPDASATIHHSGATNVYDSSTIRYGASTIQAGSVTTSHECARSSGFHVTVCQIITPKSK